MTTESENSNELQKPVNIDSDSSDFSVFNKTHKEKLFKAYALQNKERYIAVMTAVSYCLQGLVLRENSLFVALEPYDTRLSYIFAIRSGNGKKAFVDAVINIAKALNLKYSKMTSLHAEQLIGKMLVEYKGKGDNKVRVPQEIPGYFKDDILIKDDALMFLNSKEFEVSRQYFIQALDDYGRNEVSKKLVDHKREEELKYCPAFISLMFVQDKPLPRDNIETGLVRKSPMLYIEALEVTEDDLLNRALNQSPPDYTYFIKILGNAKNAAEGTITWNFTEECHRLITMKVGSLLNQIKAQGQKGQEYASMLAFTIQNYVYKYSAILSAMYDISKNPVSESREIKVIPEMCEVAAEDFEIVLMAAFAHWQKFVEDTPTRLNHWERVIIEALHEKQATDENSAITGNYAFLGGLADKFGVSVSTLYSNLKTLKQKGFVETRQVGKAEPGKENSKVWLKTA